MNSKPTSLMGREILDGVTEAVIKTDYLNNAVHKGKVFSSFFSVSKIQDAYLDLEFITPPTKYIHLKVCKKFTDLDYAIWTILEAPTITDGTTPAAPVSRRRVNPETSEAIVYSDPTAISAGTVLEQYNIGTAAKIESKEDKDIEFLLDLGTKYAFRIQNKNAAAANLSLWLLWTEEKFGLLL